MRFQNKEMPKNYLTMVPSHHVKEFTDIDGKVTLLIPKFKKEWMRKCLIPKHKTPHFRIHFDAIGSHVWRLINGRQTVEDICLKVNAKLQSEGNSIDHIEERVTLFMTDLYKRKYIVFEESTH